MSDPIEPGTPATAAAEAAALAPAARAIEFTGDGETYFGIWIVNVMLTLVTVGIYSPWAKVRRLRYFYGNTLVDGSPFEFHGSPMALLRGRIVAVALFIAYTNAAKVSLALWLAVVALLLAGAPWLFWKSLRFRLVNSSYRGIRFRFAGRLSTAYLVFLIPVVLFLAPSAASVFAAVKMKGNPQALAWLFVPILLVMLAALLVGPWLYLRIKRYQHANAMLGTTPFGFGASVGNAYGLAFRVLGIMFVAGAVGSVAAVLTGAAAAPLAGAVAHWLPPGIWGKHPEVANGMVAAGFGMVTFYIIWLAAFPFVSATVQNFVWGRTSLGGFAFASKVKGDKLLWIEARNFLMLIVTLGLYWPYATIRRMRYQLASVSWAGDPGALVAGEHDAAVTAVGVETADVFGFDFAL